MRLKSMFKHKSIRVCSVLLFLALVIGSQYACLDGLNGDGSENPINTAIIGLSANPATLYGNASEDSFIQVNTKLVPDGTPIDFEITFSPTGLQPQLRGCLFESSGTVQDEFAFVNYLAGVNIGVGSSLDEIATDIATVNVSATIHPVDGDEESDFLTMTLQGVGIAPPTPGPVTVPDITTPMAENVDITLIFQTVGIEPGTLAEVSISDPTIGTLNGGSDVVQVPVFGSINSGQFIVEYTAFVDKAGTQIILARIQLQIPPEFFAICPLISEDDGLIEVVVVITQTVAAPAPAP
jgi:hypothetical protein